MFKKLTWEEQQLQARDSIALYLVQHYDGIKSLQFSKFNKPGVFGGLYSTTVIVNNDKDNELLIDSNDMRELIKTGNGAISFDDDLTPKIDKNKNLNNVKISWRVSEDED